MTKPFNEMTIEELKEEEQMWQKRIDEATGWGAGVAAAYEFREECNKWIGIKERQV